MADPLLYNSQTSMSNRLEILTEYGKHADAEEERWDPVKIRRFLTKAVTTLFTGEPNSKRYRIALDEIAGIPKQLQSEGKSLEGQPRISELILNAAHTHLSEEVLLRTPEESYERELYEEAKVSQTVVGGISSRPNAIAEWQADRRRKQDEGSMGTYEAMLVGHDSSPFQQRQYTAIGNVEGT